MSKDKLIPTIKFKSTNTVKKSVNDDTVKNVVIDTRKVIKISGLKKLQILKTLPEKIIEDTKADNSDREKALTDPLIILKQGEAPSNIPIKFIQSNKIKKISTTNLLKFDYSHSPSVISSKPIIKKDYLNTLPARGITLKMDENIIKHLKIEDSSKVSQKVVSPKNVIKLTTPINTIKNMSMSISTHQQNLTNAKQPDITSVRLKSSPFKVLKLPLSSAVEVSCSSNHNNLIVKTPTVTNECKIVESTPAPKPISVLSSTGKKITLTPIAIAQKPESCKVQPFFKINSLPLNTQKRSIQFIPVGYTPPLKMKRPEASEEFKHLSLNEIVGIINKNNENEVCIPELAIKYGCSLKQVQQIITDHQQLVVDGHTNVDILNKNNFLYKMLLEKVIGEWYYRSKLKGKQPTDKEILEKGAESIQLFDNPGMFNLKMIAGKGWPSSIRNTISDSVCDSKYIESDKLIDIIFDLRDNLTYDLQDTIFNKKMAEDAKDGKFQLTTNHDNDNINTNGNFEKDPRKDISTYEDAYIHLLALIKFCKSIGHTDSTKHLHKLKIFIIEEMCNDNKK